MKYETLTIETMNPFSIVDGGRFDVDQYLMDSLPNQELINHFVNFIDETYYFKNEKQNMIYATSIFILTQSLELNLYKNRMQAFTRIFDILYPVFNKQ